MIRSKDNIRFIEKTQPLPGGCIEWIGSKTKLGYGRFWLNGTMRFAHRVSYEMNIGGIPKNKIIMHLCDKPSCVNPDHLVAGTHKDNTQDMLSKGRCNPPKGERGSTKLTSSDVLKIRALYNNGELQKNIAAQFDIHQVMVSQIVTNKVWSHV